MEPKLERALASRTRILCSVALCASLLVALAAIRRWPLVEDASLMHYVVFLMRSGAVPYKDILDINLPGTYFFEALSMRLFGPGATGLHLYDLSLLAAIFAAYLKLTGPQHRFAALLAGALFALVHLQDGFAQQGERDLLTAALLLWAYVALFKAQRSPDPRRNLLYFLPFGLAFGITFTIKPLLAPLALVLLLSSAWLLRRHAAKATQATAAAILGLLLPPAIALIWLSSRGALHPFLSTLRGIGLLHAELGRRPLPFLLSHCCAPIGSLLALWLVAEALQRRRPLSAERAQLILGALGTAAAYIAQGKGYPYHRYPFLAVILLLFADGLDHALQAAGAPLLAAAATCLIASLGFAPRFAWLTTTFSPVRPFQDALQSRLTAIAPPAQLSGQVQCLDTLGGCINTLYDLRVRQSTGFLYDCYLFTSDSPARSAYRNSFWTALQSARPRLLVLTNQFCFDGHDTFAKLDTWPALAQDLQHNYQQVSAWHSNLPQHWWNRRQQPYDFRIYLRNPLPEEPAALDPGHPHR